MPGLPRRSVSVCAGPCVRVLGRCEMTDAEIKRYVEQKIAQLKKELLKAISDTVNTPKVKK